MKVDNVLKKAATKASKVGGEKTKIKFAKEFFVTDEGHVIKMAAIESKNTYILDQLREE